MAKKLKSGFYEQWKQEQQIEKASSRSPSPQENLDHLERSNQLSASAASSSESEQISHSKSDLNQPNPLVTKKSFHLRNSHLLIHQKVV